MELLTSKQLALRANITPAIVGKYVRLGIIKPQMVGSTRAFVPEDADRIIGAHKIWEENRGKYSLEALVEVGKIKKARD